MDNIIKIEGSEVTRIIYKGKPVVTLKMVDELHKRPEGTARKAFNRNKERFVEGYHYFNVPYKEWTNIVSVRLTDAHEEDGSPSNGRPEGGYRGDIIFITEPGYLLIVKPFSDDLAWKVQDALIKDYFETKETLSRMAALSTEFEAFIHIAKLAGLEGNQAILCGNKGMINYYGKDCLGIIGATHLINSKQERLLTPTELGKDLGISAQSANKLLVESGIIEPKRDHKNKVFYLPTEKGTPFCVLMDTGKQRSNGTPVHQLKFYESIKQTLV